MIYPRLLLVTSNAFNHLSGGGVTFTNLFHGWPKDKIACVHSDRTPPTSDVCEKYYKLGIKEFPWMFPFSLAIFFVGQEKMESQLREVKSFGARTGLKTKLLKKAFAAAQAVFGDEIPMTARISNKLRAFIEDFKPQVIYTILGSLQYIRLVKKIAEEFNLPIVIHMMDDWPEVLYRRGIFGPYRRWRMKIELQRLMNEACGRLGICDAMSEAYSKRYGRHFDGAFHNALDGAAWLEKARNDWSRKSPFTIIYGGALMPDSQLHSVKDVSDAVAELHDEGLDIEFKICAPWYFAKPYRDELERQGCVFVLDMPEKMDVEDLFAKADLLLLPVNFDAASVKYIKYSMPTKVPAYMFSGTPILAYGPAEVASIRYAQKYKWAYCVTNKNKTELKNAIKRLASDEKLRRNLALHAQKLARERHDRGKIAQKFQDVIISSVERFC